MTMSTDPRSFLPLTPLVFQVLLTLADEPRHGYAIIREVETRTDGLIRLRTGTLYALLPRLLDQGLLEESAGRAPEHDDERRRYYAVTPLGRDVLKAEARRLELAVEDARRKHVLGRAGKA
jgi:DNA-binding PadR family transcriptional regulator